LHTYLGRKARGYGHVIIVSVRFMAASAKPPKRKRCVPRVSDMVTDAPSVLVD
jgi:hypothetical protein